MGVGATPGLSSLCSSVNDPGRNVLYSHLRFFPFLVVAVMVTASKMRPVVEARQPVQALTSIMDGRFHYGRMEDEREAGARRALELLWRLQRGESLAVGDIQALQGVSAGTARRSFNVLQTHPGVVVEKASRPARLIYADPVLASRPAARTTAVISSCLAASLSSLFSGSRYETQMRSLRDQLVRHAGLRHPPEHLDRKFLFLAGGGEQAVTTAAHLLDDILEGVLSSRELDIEYSNFEGSTTNETLRPLSLVVHQHQLYVVAFNARYDRHHPFRVSRFQNVELTNRTFPYPDPDAYAPAELFRDSFGIFVTSKRPVKVRVRLDARWSTYVDFHRWHPTQQTFRRRDGRIDVQLCVVPCPELLQWVLSFGREAEVVAPESLRRLVHRQVEELAMRYRERGRTSKG